MKIRGMVILFLEFWVICNTFAQSSSDITSYILQFKQIALDQEREFGIPAPITLAQGILESGAGKSGLTRKSNNHFGIKKGTGWNGPLCYAWDDDPQKSPFRVYSSAAESYRDHSMFLKNNSRYRSLFSKSVYDYRGWANGLQRAGYATSPTYAEQLIGIIEVYNLDQYDRATKYDKFLAKHNGLDRPSNAAGGNLHQIYQLNKNYYVVVRSGDTFKSLGKELNISWRKLVRYNELNKHDQLYPGDYIFLKKKQSRAEKQFKGHPHRVRAGESMYDIAQHYGIRLKSLYKLNHMSPDYQIQAGDLLRVR